MKKIIFLNGEIIESQHDCLGCFITENIGNLCEELQPIYDDGELIILQDAEIPMPGFFILTTHKHIQSFSDLSTETSMKIGKLIKKVIGIHKELNIPATNVYFEEKDKNSHFHIWLMPVYGEQKIKIAKNNINEYLNSFDYKSNYEKILKLNAKARDKLSKLKCAEIPN